MYLFLCGTCASFLERGLGRSLPRTSTPAAAVAPTVSAHRRLLSLRSRRKPHSAVVHGRPDPQPVGGGAATHLPTGHYDGSRGLTGATPDCSGPCCRRFRTSRSCPGSSRPPRRRRRWSWANFRTGHYFSRSVPAGEAAVEPVPGPALLSASGTGDADVVEDVVLGHASPAGLQFPGAGVHHRGPLPGGGWCGCSQDAMTGV